MGSLLCREGSRPVSQHPFNVTKAVGKRRFYHAVPYDGTYRGWTWPVGLREDCLKHFRIIFLVSNVIVGKDWAGIKSDPSLQIWRMGV